MNIIDIIIVLCILFIAFACAGKGLFKSLSGVAAYIASAVAAKLTAPVVAEEIYVRAVHQKVLALLDSQFPSGSVQGEINNIIDSVVAVFPENVKVLMEHFGVTLDFAQTGNSFLTVGQLEADYAAPMIIKVLAAIATVVIFCLCVFLLRVIFNAIDGVIFKRKTKGILSGANKFFGFIFGLLKACIIIGIVCIILNIVAPLTGSSVFSEYVNSSVVCAFIAQII